MKYPTKQKYIAPFAFILISLCLNSAHAGKMYKWVDKDGRVSYQDSPPPKSGKLLETTEVQSSAAPAEQTNPDKVPIKVYTVANCAPCGTVVQHLKKQDVPVVELPLQNDREAQSIILERTESLIAPSVFIGNRILQGGDIDAIDAALKQNGYTLALEKQKEEESRSSQRLTLSETSDEYADED